MELRKMQGETGKPLTEELLEVELAAYADATLDDFREISLPNTPTVLDGATSVFDEHFKVLESLENYLEAQHLVASEDNDHSSGISTSPSIHEVHSHFTVIFNVIFASFSRHFYVIFAVFNNCGRFQLGFF